MAGEFRLEAEGYAAAQDARDAVLRERELRVQKMKGEADHLRRYLEMVNASARGPVPAIDKALAALRSGG